MRLWVVHIISFSPWMSNSNIMEELTIQKLSWSIANTFIFLFLHKHSNGNIFVVNPSFLIEFHAQARKSLMFWINKDDFFSQIIVLVSCTLSRVKKATLPQAHCYSVIFAFLLNENWTILNNVQCSFCWLGNILCSF